MADSLRTELVLVLHNHQPVGNLAQVIRLAFERSYRPLLDQLVAHPNIRLAMHHSGPLFEWLLRNEPGYLADLKALVEREQVEIVGGGFYEPMLVMLPDQDIRGQIEMMSAFIDRHLNTTPRGLWLAERVWDPDLPRTLEPAGVQYVLLDDSHLMAAGLIPENGLEVSGYYVTEKAGATVAVFPISRSLRYAIPFRPVDEVINSIENAGRALAAHGRSTILTYGDDGEKFGLWPGTENTAHPDQWLDRFFSLLEDHADSIVTTTPSTVLARHACNGRVYMPTGAYEEMDAWVLPPQAERLLSEIREAARSAAPDTLLAKATPFLRGGVWSGFLAKYSEANRMHKKMVQVSARLDEAYAARRTDALYGDKEDLDDKLATAQRALYAGQCCCAYWHGWFGGIYLNYLRHAVLEQLLDAEVLLDGLLRGPEPAAQFERVDIDGDLADEALLSNKLLNAYAAPAQGGALISLDDRQRRCALVNVMTRRKEAYHDTLPAQHPLYAKLHYDDVSRLCFIDRFYAQETSAAAVRDNPALDIGTFAKARYSLVELGRREDIDDGVEAVLRADGEVHSGNGTVRLRIAKRYLLPRDAAALQVVYTITHEEGPRLHCLFAPELNLSLLGDMPPERTLQFGEQKRISPAETGELSGCDEISIVDRPMDLATVVSAEGCSAFWHYPVNTISRSEVGFVDNFQGVAILPVFNIDLKAGSVLDLSVLIGVESLSQSGM